MAAKEETPKICEARRSPAPFLRPLFWSLRCLGFRALGFRALGFKIGCFRVFRGLGFRVFQGLELHYQDFGAES